MGKVMFELDARTSAEVPSDALVRLDDGREVRAAEAPSESFAWCVNVVTKDWPSGRTVNAVHTPLGYRVEGQGFGDLPIPPGGAP